MWDELAGAFGLTLPNEVGNRLDKLVELASDEWDFRRGAERNRAHPEVGATLPPRHVDLIAEAARALRLCHDTLPAGREYDAVVILGGLLRACLGRAHYARSLVETGISVPVVAVLTADRLLSEDEKQLEAYGYTTGAETEADAAREGLFQAFGYEVGRRAGRAPQPRQEIYHTPAGVELKVIVAAPSSGQKRATTRDTYDFWSLVAPDAARVLIVTTSIYAPYQGSVAAEALGLAHGISVETVGTALSAGPFTQKFEWWHHLQEMRSAVVALQSLYRALEADGRSIYRLERS